MSEDLSSRSGLDNLARDMGAVSRVEQELLECGSEAQEIGMGFSSPLVFQRG